VEYQHVVEVLNKLSHKRRLVACRSQEEAETFSNIFNLVSSYRHYQSQIVGGGEGPEFVSEWVVQYLKHQGEMYLSTEMIKPGNIQNLVNFGRENSAIKSLIFGSPISFR
jgi:hypothetical protein